MYEKLVVLLLTPWALGPIVILGIVSYFYIKDRGQTQHSIMRTHPLLGRLRYFFEFVGKPFRQYWFLNDKEGRPIDRDTAETIAKASKYGQTIRSFGSVKDFDKADFYISNSMFPKNIDELNVDNSKKMYTYQYKILKEGEFSRKEKRFSTEISPWLLKESDQVVIGEKSLNPYKVRGLIGISAMSFGALSSPAVRSLAQGVAISGGSWMNTGEGSISQYHLSKMYEKGDVSPSSEIEKRIFKLVKEKRLISNFGIEEKIGEKARKDIKAMVKKGILKETSTDLIFQIGSGLYGARDRNSEAPLFSEKEFLKNALRPEVKAIELKLAQGAKVKGGHIEAEKVTEEIAEIRGVQPFKTIESPNRFNTFHDVPTMVGFVEELKRLSEKPVGIKVVIGDESTLVDLAKYMKETGLGPDFITVDGGNGGTGATYQEMADSLGLPVYSAVAIAHKTLLEQGVRSRVVIIASGMLATADKMAIALSLGADLINVARAAMNTIGCINAMKCHTNECPVGVTSHKKELQRGIVVEEKRFRTANYLTTMRKGLFMLAASCGLDSPAEFSHENIVFKDTSGKTTKPDKIF